MPLPQDITPANSEIADVLVRASQMDWIPMLSDPKRSFFKVLWMISRVLAYSAASSVWDGGRIAMRWAVAAVVVVVVALLATAANAAPITACTGSLGAVTVEGDVDVPTGAACSLLGTSVTGNVTLEGGLIAGTVHIRGT
jgi:hypothetical protein